MQQQPSTTTDAVLKNRKKKKKTHTSDWELYAQEKYFPLISCVHDSDLGTFHSLHHEGQILRFQKRFLCTHYVLIAQVAKVYSPLPAQYEETDMKKLVLSVPLSCNWIMSDNAFYTVISDWFILSL